MMHRESRKRKWMVAVTLILILPILLMNVVFSAKSDPGLNAFDAIWQAINALKADLVVLKTDSTTAKQSITNLNASVASIHTALNTVKEDAAATSSNVDGLKTRVSSLETNAAEVNADMTALQAENADLQGQVKTLKEKNDALDSAIQGIKEQLAALQPGPSEPSGRLSSFAAANLPDGVQGFTYQIAASVRNSLDEPITGLCYNDFSLTGTVPSSDMFPFGAQIKKVVESSGVYLIDVQFLPGGQYALHLKVKGIEIAGTLNASITADNNPDLKKCTYVSSPDAVPMYNHFEPGQLPYKFDIIVHMVNAEGIALDNLDLNNLTLFMMKAGIASASGLSTSFRENMGNGDYVFHCQVYPDPTLVSGTVVPIAVVYSDYTLGMNFQPIGPGWEQIVINDNLR